MSDTDPQLTARIDEAAATIGPLVLNTPLWRAPWLDGPNCHAWIKLENLQHTGSFKVRGATNFLIRNRERLGDSVVAASTGNHGAAVAFAASRLGIRARIFIPESTSASKLESMERLGAEVQRFGADAVESELAARRDAKDRGELYISPYNDFDVIAGQGTIAFELLSTLDNVDAVVASVGGGGLLSGVASRLRTANPHTRVIGVSPEASAVMAASLAAGKVVDQPSRQTLSDATAGGLEPGAVTFELCSTLVDEFPLVSEIEIADGMRDLLFHQRIVGEGAAGCAIAGFRRVAGNLAGNVVIIVCGGNIAPLTLAEVARSASPIRA